MGKKTLVFLFIRWNASHYGSKCVGDTITVDFKISQVHLDKYLKNTIWVQISQWFATYFVVLASHFCNKSFHLFLLARFWHISPAKQQQNIFFSFIFCWHWKQKLIYDFAVSIYDLNIAFSMGLERFQIALLNTDALPDMKVCPNVSCMLVAVATWTQSMHCGSFRGQYWHHWCVALC